MSINNIIVMNKNEDIDPRELEGVGPVGPSSLSLSASASALKTTLPLVGVSGGGLDWASRESADGGRIGLKLLGGEGVGSVVDIVDNSLSGDGHGSKDRGDTESRLPLNNPFAICIRVLLSTFSTCFASTVLLAPSLLFRPPHHSRKVLVVLVWM